MLPSLAESFQPVSLLTTASITDRCGIRKTTLLMNDAYVIFLTVLKKEPLLPVTVEEVVEGSLGLSVQAFSEQAF